MNELWIVGIVGGGAGAAMGGPLLLRRGSDHPWTIERLAGAWLCGGALGMLLVGMRHGGLFEPPLEGVIEHFTNGLALISWTFVLMLVRRIAGIDGRWPSSVADHLLLPFAYWTIIIGLGFPDIRFLWLLPIIIACLVAIGGVWWRTRGHRNPDIARQINAVFLFSVLQGVAQILRSLFPRVIELREIVPIVVTASFFAIGFALSGRAFVTDKPMYRKSGLTSARAHELVGKLDEGMSTHAWYRDADLTLAALAARLSVPAHALSQALNQLREQTLIEYLASWRMADAKQRLADPASDCYTVEGVARQSGFASRSAFYKAFKSAEGMTPTEFRDRFRGATL